MKKLFTLLLSFGAATVLAQAPAIQWQKSLGGTRSDYAYSIQQTTDGGYIIAGSSQSYDGDVSGNHGGPDYWIAKLDNAGVIQWQKSLGGTGYDFAQSIQQTIDGGYIVAGSSESNNGDVSGNHGALDYWVVKLDDTGAFQWQKSLGGTGDDQAQSIRQTADGGYVVAGISNSTSGNITGNHGGYDFWVVKLNDTGAIQWQKSLGGTDYDNANSIHQTADGGYIVAGNSQSNDGDISGTHHGSVSYDSWVVKLDNAGAIQWEKSLGGTSDDVANSIQQTADGGYIVAGYSNSTDGDVTGHHGNNYADSWVLKLDDAGAIQWQKSLGGTLHDITYSIQQTTDGGYITAGISNSNNGDVSGNHGGSDAWVVKLDTAGIIQWQKALGGTGSDASNSIQKTADNGYIIAGSSISTNGDVSGNHGSADFWVVKLGPGPTAVSNTSLAESFSLFPNPATNELTIQSSEAIRSVLLTDISGKKVTEISGNGLQSLIIPTAGLANGFYFVRVATDKGTSVQRVLVQHP